MASIPQAFDAATQKIMADIAKVQLAAKGLQAQSGATGKALVKAANQLESLMQAADKLEQGQFLLSQGGLYQFENQGTDSPVVTDPNFNLPGDSPIGEMPASEGVLSTGDASS